MRMADYYKVSLKESRGFTLVEVMMTVVILGILAGVIYVNVSDAGAQGRDSKRQGDLRNLQNAIELYKNKYGRYPERCPSSDPNWSGHKDTDFACNNGTGQYIVDLAPEFITTLPTDPKLAETLRDDSGYVYTVNSEGTVYKLMVRRTVESETVSIDHEFKACNIQGSRGGLGAAFLCDSTCRSNNVSVFQSSYAVWGGFEADEDDTKDVICLMN